MVINVLTVSCASKEHLQEHSCHGLCNEMVEAKQGIQHWRSMHGN